MADLILGIDPSTRRTGFGVIAVDGDRLEHVEHGVIPLSESWELAQRLHVLYSELHKLYAKYPLRSTVVEKIFFGKNADSAFKLGHARGVCLMIAASNRVEVEEYAAKYVKKCVTGSGGASKEHVQMVVMALLKMRGGGFSLDASDALALAITHARSRDVNLRMKKALEREL